MSAVTQLSFLPPAQDEIQKALRLFQDSGVLHVHFNRFIRSLAVSFKSAGAGATIVAACPGAPTLDEVIVGLRKEIRRFEARNHQPPSVFEPVEVSAPSRPTRATMEVELLDRYTQALQTVRIGHRGQPLFLDDNLGFLYQARTSIGRLVTLLKAKNPPLVIVRDAQNLKCPNSSDDEDRGAWRTIMDIARQSGVPHIMFAPISTVSTILADPEFMGQVHLEVLRPYDLTVPCELASFNGTLHDYNSAMPWLEKESLVARSKDIDLAVAGDVDRLRRWVVRAVNCALSEEDTSRISWRHFQQTRPLPAQQNLAHADRGKSIALLDPVEVVTAPATGGSPAKPIGNRPKPGDRRPGRDKMIAL